MIHKLIGLTSLCLILFSPASGMQKMSQEEEKIQVISHQALKRTNPALLDQRGKNNMLGAVALYGDLKLVKKCLDAGANVNAQKEDNLCSALHAAAGQGHLAVVKLLLKQDGIQVDLQTSIGMTALSLAAVDGCTEIVKVLLAAKANIEAVDFMGYTALHYAALAGKEKVVKLLLERGADVKAVATEKTVVGCTPLHLAAEIGNLAIMGLLLSKGADIEACDGKGFTPLHSAAGKGMAQAVLFLLKRNANKEARARGGFTPLHYAAANNRVEVVRLLIQKDADLSAMSDARVTPLQLAKSKGHAHAIALLDSALKSKQGCVVCAKKDPDVTLSKCGRCCIPSYCSIDCQKVDWRSHKPLCEREIVIVEREDGV